MGHVSAHPSCGCRTFTPVRTWQAFAAAGANVVVADIDTAAAAATVAELNALPGASKSLCVSCNVTREPELGSLVQAAVRSFGRLDCLVNNSGFHPPHFTIDEFSRKDCEDLFALNFFSIFSLCKLALPHLRQVQGSIINISSLVGAQGQLRATTYAATKGAPPCPAGRPAPPPGANFCTAGWSPLQGPYPRSPKPWPWKRRPTTCASTRCSRATCGPQCGAQHAQTMNRASSRPTRMDAGTCPPRWLRARPPNACLDRMAGQDASAGPLWHAG